MVRLDNGRLGSTSFQDTNTFRMFWQRKILQVQRIPNRNRIDIPTVHCTLYRSVWLPCLGAARVDLGGRFSRASRSACGPLAENQWRSMFRPDPRTLYTLRSFILQKTSEPLSQHAAVWRCWWVGPSFWGDFEVCLCGPLNLACRLGKTT